MTLFSISLRKSLFAVGISTVVAFVYAGKSSALKFPLAFEEANPIDSPVVPKDTTNRLRYPLVYDKWNPYLRIKNNSLDLKTPNAVQSKVEYDSAHNEYRQTTKVGKQEIVDSKYVPFGEYVRQDTKEWIQDYFRRRSASQVNVLSKSLVPPKTIKEGGMFEGLFGGLVDIRPTGSAELIFGWDYNRTLNPNWSVKEQTSKQFKFDQKIQMNVLGNIGNRVKLNLSYDTQAAFDFQNQKKINYNGKEDEIVKNFEIGDVSMPISNSLITGSHSLFGVKGQFQFGKLYLTGVFSQNKGEKKEITVENGAQRTKFDITADNYESNKHFFLSQYFRDNFEQANKNYPSFSPVIISKVEVWVTNGQGNVQNTRNIVGMMDVGEAKPYNKTLLDSSDFVYPENQNNNLFSKYIITNKGFRETKSVGTELNNAGFKAVDYARLDNARLLSATEYTLNGKLGYISLNVSLKPDDVVAVAYEYTVGGQRFQVGEFSKDVPPDVYNPNVLYVKLLKGTSTRTDVPLWNLMMKNVYSLNAYQIQATDFKLQVIYEDNESGAYLNYLPVPSDKGVDGIPLIRLLGLDRFNSQVELKADGNFDYLEGVTVNSSNGRIIFPVLEPFGKSLRKKFADPVVAEKFIYDSLYSSTKSVAIQQASKNKFYLRGYYQSTSGSEISLGAFNIPQGAVKVYAGGQELHENSDFTVDYSLGRVKIINPGIISSGSVIRVQLESNSLFSIQQKTMMGTRAEYKFSKDFNLGGTLLYLRERPLTTKVNIGEEPIRNAIWGLDGSYTTDSRFLTKMVDKLPFYETKEKSNILLKGEFAQIIPGHPTLLDGVNNKEKGVSYLDDFEASEVGYDLRLGNYWSLASTPTSPKFPESGLFDNIASNYNRAKLTWYTIDPIFFRNNTLTPAHIKSDLGMQSDPYMREVIETEVFPNKQLPTGTPGTLATLDLTYYPNERGPYNFNTDDLDADGYLLHPEKHWGGIMRKIDNSDFEASNIQYVEFWMMDPLIKNNNLNGEIVLNLGNVSEDILKDGRESWENGLPKTSTVDNVDSTAYARIPKLLHITRAFDNDATSRKYQDVGYDGLGPTDTDNDERDYLEKKYSYLTKVQSKVKSSVYPKFDDDPSADNFHFYTGDDYNAANADIIRRYKYYNNPQGNTPVANTGAANSSGYGTTNPDDEDLNGDFTLNQTEEFFEYKIKINTNDLKFRDKNYITDILTVPVTTKDKKTTNITWYQFKVPVNDFLKKVGQPDLKSIRFMRMYMTGFTDQTTIRFARMDLVRGEWRKNLFSLKSPGQQVTVDDDNTNFTVASVSLEKNGHSKPPYVIPPGIIRDVDQTTPDQIAQNEQSLALRICGLDDGDARSVFKNTQFDVRLYKHLKFFVHAHQQNNTLRDDEAHIFIRVGADQTNNYYEYEAPLKVTNTSSKSKDEIWPEQNRMDILLSDLYGAKQLREVKGASLLAPFTTAAADGKGIVTVVGNPDLGNMKTIMIGIRNPKDDGKPLCGEFWLDELRITEFDESTGWAANLSANVKLADLGTVSSSVTRRSIGFGTLEQSVQQRSQKETSTFDIASSLRLGKLLPKMLYLEIPFYVSYSENSQRPRFNPLRQDLPFNDVVNAYDGFPSKKDSVLKANLDFTSRTNLNFTNVKKMPNPKRKSSYPWDIENVYVTYSYSEVFKRNIEKIYDYDKLYKGVIGYNYNFKAKSVEPFKKLGEGKAGPYLKLISEFNFYYLPQTFAFTQSVDRKFGEILYRNTDDYKSQIIPIYDKYFKMNRTYDFRYNLAKSLKFSYSGKADLRVSEPDGKIDQQWKKDSVKNNIISPRLYGYNHNVSLSYDVPINKLPLLDWTTLQTTYQGTYGWAGAPPASPNIKNTISNAENININGQLNFAGLYSKIPFLKKIVQGQSNIEDIKKKQQEEANKKRSKTGKDTLEKQIPINEGAIRLAENSLRLLMTIRAVSVNYSYGEGTTIPGFQHQAKYLGMDPNNAFAPGPLFVLGLQQDVASLQKTIADNDWLQKGKNIDTSYTAYLIKTKTINFTGNATLEPLKNFRITVDFTKRYVENYQTLYRWTEADNGHYQAYAPVTTGSFSISILPISTSFIKDKPNNISPVFEQLQLNRLIVARRLSDDNIVNRGKINPTTGFPMGYGGTQQEVLMYSFMAAYLGKDANTIALSPFINMPMPNWRVNYNGLNNIEFVKKFAKNITFNHSYKSLYTVGNYQTTLLYDPNKKAVGDTNLRAKLQIDNMVITEDFAPLGGLDITWVNNMTTRIEYKKSRNLSFGFTNYQLTEIKSDEFTIGAGYKTNKFLIPFARRGKKKFYLQNELTARLDFSIRDNKTTIRVLDQGQAQSASGQQILSLQPNIDYVLSKSLTAKIFYKRQLTTPHVSTQYPTSQHNIGFSLRYTLTP